MLITYFCFRDRFPGELRYLLTAPRHGVARLLRQPVSGDAVQIVGSDLPIFDPLSSDERLGIASIDSATGFTLCDSAATATEADWEAFARQIADFKHDEPADAIRVELRVARPARAGGAGPSGAARGDGAVITDLDAQRRRREAARRR